VFGPLLRDAERKPPRKKQFMPKPAENDEKHTKNYTNESKQKSQDRKTQEIATKEIQSMYSLTRFRGGGMSWR